MLLNPYFHGTTSRSGAPFWFGQHRPVQADGEDRQRVHGFVQPQPLDVRPVEHGLPLAGHLPGVEQRGELDEPGPGVRLGPVDQRPKREPDPRNHHRPAFDAAQAVDALLEGLRLHQVIEREVPLPAALAVHPNGPRTRPKRPGIPRGRRLVGSELVEVVVGRDVFVGRPRLARAEGTRHDVGQAVGALRIGDERVGAGNREPDRRQPGGRHELAPAPGTDVRR